LGAIEIAEGGRGWMNRANEINYGGVENPSITVIAWMSWRVDARNVTEGRRPRRRLVSFFQFLIGVLLDLLPGTFSVEDGIVLAKNGIPSNSHETARPLRRTG
jgi:hypothetical protein